MVARLSIELLVININFPGQNIQILVLSKISIKITTNLSLGMT